MSFRANKVLRLVVHFSCRLALVLSSPPCILFGLARVASHHGNGRRPSSSLQHTYGCACTCVLMQEMLEKFPAEHIIMEYSPGVPERNLKLKELMSTVKMLQDILHAGYTVVNIEDKVGAWERLGLRTGAAGACESSCACACANLHLIPGPRLFEEKKT
eukprot:349929-Chlamydomonas_euryale.AAC.13